MFFLLFLSLVKFSFLFSFLLIVGMSSFGDESHSVSYISELQGSGQSSTWEASSLDLGEVRATFLDLGEVGTSFQEAIQVGQLADPTATMFPPSPSSTVSTMTPKEIKKLRKQYCFPSEVCVIIPYPEDRVTLGLSGCVALYEEFLHTGLCFPIHPFVRTILSFYQLVLT